MTITLTKLWYWSQSTCVVRDVELLTQNSTRLSVLHVFNSIHTITNSATINVFYCFYSTVHRLMTQFSIVWFFFYKKTSPRRDVSSCTVQPPLQHSAAVRPPLHWHLQHLHSVSAAPTVQSEVQPHSRVRSQVSLLTESTNVRVMLQGMCVQY